MRCHPRWREGAQCNLAVGTPKDRDSLRLSRDNRRLVCNRSRKCYRGGACSAKRGKNPSSGPLVESLFPAEDGLEAVCFMLLRRWCGTLCPSHYSSDP